MRFGVRIAVVAGIAEQRAAAAQQREIDAPGIDAEAVDAAVLRRALAQGRQHFAVEPQHVPVQRIEGADGAVGEAVDDFELEALAVEAAEDAAAALGAEVEGEEFLGGGHGTSPSDCPDSSGGTPRFVVRGLHLRVFAVIMLGRMIRGGEAVARCKMSVRGGDVMTVHSHTTGQGRGPLRRPMPLCQQSVRWLKRLDWFARLEFADARHPEEIIAGREPPLEPGRLLEEMHLLTPDGGRVYHGFAAFRWIAWRLPPLVAAGAAPVRARGSHLGPAVVPVDRPQPLSAGALPRRSLYR